MTSTANVRDNPGAPASCLVWGPWNAFITSLKSSPSGSTASSVAPTSSLTRSTTLVDKRPSTMTAPSRSIPARTSSGSADASKRSRCGPVTLIGLRPVVVPPSAAPFPLRDRRHASQVADRSWQIQHLHHVQQQRLVSAHHADVGLGRDQRSLGAGLGPHQTAPRVYLGRDRNGGEEPELLGAVVDGAALSGDAHSLCPERGEQAQREEAVGDRAAERTVPLRSLDVGVDPLVVAG